ncbi:T9SS type A sorting domain-containing protein [Flavobacteriaceae bacterium Ap0902]|nr:T9SS type A sorting domain-containing protein [Flavobacteriaceae bacterium Ap0902]
MKKVLFSLFAVGAFVAGTAQTVLFSDDFEDYEAFAIDNIGDWTLVDGDGLFTYGFSGVAFPNSGVPKAFQVFNHTQTDPSMGEPTETSDWTGYGGSDQAMVAFASVPEGGQYNDDWLISPSIELQTGNQVRFFYKAANSTYGAEKFEVGISTSGTNPDDFEMLTDVITINPSVQGTDYDELVLPLDADYDGQTVHIAIHCISQDQFGFMVDDFSVVSGSMATNEVDFDAKNSIALYPNPAKDVVKVALGSDFDANKVQVVVTSMTGQVVSKSAYSTKGLNISNLPAGVYVLTVTDGKNTQTKKLIKK